MTNSSRVRRPLSRRSRLTILVITLSLAMGAGVLHGMAAPRAAALEVHKVGPAKFDPTPDKPVFVLVLGFDARPGETVSRSDAMHLIALNPAAGRATMLNIPRDTYVPIPGHGSDKINSAYALGGAKLTAKAVGDLVGVQIQFVLATGFTGLADMVDEMGGVTVDIPVKMEDSNSDAYFDKGPRHLTGPESLAFSRDRHSTGGGDFDRTHRQGELILAGLTKLRGEDPSPASTLKWLGVLLRHTTLDGVSIPELYRLGRTALAIDPANVANVNVPGEPGVAGSASVIYTTAAAGPLFADFRDDGLVSPPS
ncbi:MAG: polyisoprenyl-teichoic acid--peptidoglycan teichoic acid transferase [Actinomycetota bacterium]|jgi:LCP family protein required for cell wall assembly|nr:polyisoprenyl-teichoic acid--peptidoglycan teichoic acid transferase [Actinomycetota bacterium]